METREHQMFCEKRKNALALAACKLQSNELHLDRYFIQFKAK